MLILYGQGFCLNTTSSRNPYKSLPLLEFTHGRSLCGSTDSRACFSNFGLHILLCLSVSLSFLYLSNFLSLKKSNVSETTNRSPKLETTALFFRGEALSRDYLLQSLTPSLTAKKFGTVLDWYMLLMFFHTSKILV